MFAHRIDAGLGGVVANALDCNIASDVALGGRTNDIAQDWSRFGLMVITSGNNISGKLKTGIIEV